MKYPYQSSQDELSPVIGFIDLGTNSVRLLLVRINPNFSFTILRREKQVIRLGEGEFTDKRILPGAIDRAVLVCRRYNELCQRYQAKEIHAVATSAIRDAENKNEVIALLEAQTGIGFTVISGEEEARLIWRGICSGMDIGNEKVLLIDIGGGSTELVVGNQDQYWVLSSIKMGAVRTTTVFFPDGCIDPVNDDSIQKIRQHVQNKISHTVNKIQKNRPTQAFGSSGTILTLESVAGKMQGMFPDHLPGILTRRELRQLITYLSGLPLQERKKVPGLSADRADIILAGAVILYTVLKETGMKEIHRSEKSLRDGLLIEYLSRVPGFPYYEEIPVRWRSVHHLAKSCQIDESHAEHVTGLALLLFDSAKICGLHSLGEEYRELLEYAAILHDIGQFIAFSGHQNHSYYLIANTPLLGFNRQEIEIIAQIAGNHRKRLKMSAEETTITCDAETVTAINKMAVFLRIAENLDRSYDSRVVSAEFTDGTAKKVTLLLSCIRDCTLERLALLDEQKLFEKVFFRELETRWTGTEMGSLLL